MGVTGARKRSTRERLEPHLGRLFAYAVALTRDRTDAEDLVQDCAVRVLSAKRIPDEEVPYRAWSFRILRNLFIDRCRAASRQGIAWSDSDDSPETAPAARTEERLVSTLTVRMGMERLSTPHREMLALVDMCGYSYAEAAEILEIPAGTVMSRVSRARRALLNQIAASNIREMPLGRERKQS